jgi:hypothetical protein
LDHPKILKHKNFLIKRFLNKDSLVNNKEVKMNKKAAEMTIGTIIVIILALVVLVVLIYGFSTGWSNLWNNIIGYGGGQINVQTVVDSCKLACTTQATFDYCTKLRNVNAQGSDGKVKTFETTCEKLRAGGIFTTTKPAGDSVSLSAQDFGDCGMNCFGADDCAKAKDTACVDNAGKAIAKCNTQWMTPAELATNQQNDVGTGKKYLEISQVSNVAAKGNGDVCTKIVLN